MNSPLYKWKSLGSLGSGACHDHGLCSGWVASLGADLRMICLVEIPMVSFF